MRAFGMDRHWWQRAFPTNSRKVKSLPINTLLSLLGFAFLLALGLVYVFFSDVKSVTDDMAHHLYSRYFWRYPEIMLSQWQRPLYTLLTAFPALFGYRVHCLSSVVFSLFCCGFAMGIARHYGLRNTFLIPIIMATTPVYAETFWTTLSEPPFAALLCFALWCHVKGFHGMATMLAGFLPLVRPEGAVVVLIWIIQYLWQKRLTYLPWILLGATFWLVAAWAITGDVLYPLRASYQFNPGFREVQWDYVLKFYDDFSGPLWFVAAAVGLIAWRGIRLDLVHAAYMGIFLFFMFFRHNIEELPQGHISWRWLASIAPLLAFYALKGLNVFVEGRLEWALSSERSLRLLLLALGAGWTAVAVIYVAKGNAYAPNLLVLALIGDLSILFWLSSVRWNLGLRRALSIALVVLALAYTLWKVPFYKADEAEIAVRRLAHWWVSDPHNDGVRVNCALFGFYYYAGLDPVYHQKSEGALPGVPGGIVIWDSWAFGSWGRLSYRQLEEAGYVRVPCPVTTTALDLRVYRRPASSAALHEGRFRPQPLLSPVELCSPMDRERGPLGQTFVSAPEDGRISSIEEWMARNFASSDREFRVIPSENSLSLVADDFEETDEKPVHSR
jgi:hypothetical protein